MRRAPESHIARPGTESDRQRARVAAQRRKAARRVTQQLDGALSRLIHRLVVITSSAVIALYLGLQLLHGAWLMALPLVAQGHSRCGHCVW